MSATAAMRIPIERRVSLDETADGLRLRTRGTHGGRAIGSVSYLELTTFHSKRERRLDLSEGREGRSVGDAWSSRPGIASEFPGVEFSYLIAARLALVELSIDSDGIVTTVYDIDGGDLRRVIRDPHPFPLFWGLGF